MNDIPSYSNWFRSRRLLAAAAAGLLCVASLPAAASAADAEPAAVQALIRQGSGTDSRLSTFYRARGYRPLWVKSDSLASEARTFVRALRGTGFPAAANLDAAVAAARGGAPAALADAELRLTQALLAFVDDVPNVNVGMNYIDEELEPRSERRGPTSISSLRDVDDLIEGLDRGNPVYVQLRHALAAYRQRWGSLPQVRIPGGPALRVGARGSRVQALRRRLGLPASGTFDPQVAEILKSFQRAHGLPDDGIAGTGTIAALNRGPAHYERLLEANLARARALPENPGRRFILVDAAAARLWMYENGRPVDSMRVIVGKSSEQTPMMAALIRYAALNPYWNIPPDLARVRAVNVQRQGPSYLQREQYEVLSDWSENAVVLHPSQVDWAAVAAGRQQLRMRQLPGPRNMMGEIKLMMPNHLGIYLHDTPDRELFNRSDRWLSSGCVRLEDAWRLSRWLFGRDIGPTSGEPEEEVKLRRLVPVFITYLTVAPSEGGLEFRDDIYNRDRSLLAQLDRGSARFASTE
ncbi:murein L,D-transpeptidase [Sphingosinicella sp. CPCC 101087]|uniref:L,D-transpeptidase family protein n=1 Tax=Sphingosinicella sp. CPCC 101087 TaxID=2497754 RepID=UPI00101D5023|nr:L,D-transpeptidase family protein [Sphingosinicella sp. CPCC 101087]